MRNWILTALSLVVGELSQRCLPTRAKHDIVRRTRAVSRLGTLSMAGLLTCVLSAVELAAAHVAASEGANPVSGHIISTISCMRPMTIPLLLSVITQDLLLDLPAITPCWYSSIAGSTQTLMARLTASMLSTRQDLSTNLSAAPSQVVICFGTSLRDFMFPTKAHLCWTQMRTRRTGACMARKLTRMWTFSSTLFGTCVAT